MVTEAFLSKVMAEELMSVDEEGSSVSLEETEGTASNSLENVRTVASSNTSLNHSNVSKDLFLQIA